MLTRDIAHLVREQWERLGLRPPAPARMEVLKVSPHDDSPKVLLFVFAAGRKFPAAVVKVARSDAAAARLRRAHCLLGELRPRLPAALRAALPRPLIAARIGGYDIALETYLPGAPMYRLYPAHPTRLHRARIGRDFRLALAWLTDFHQATRTGADAASDAYGELATLDPALRSSMHPSPAEIRAVEGALAALSGRRREIPLVCQQGDYWPRNLLTIGARIAVCDWEWSEPAALPFLDAFLFVISYGLLLGAGSRRTQDESQGLLRAFAGDGWFARLCRDFVLTYMKRLGIDPALAPSFFYLALAHMAVRGYAATGTASKNDRRFHALLRTAVEQELVKRGWLGRAAG